MIVRHMLVRRALVVAVAPVLLALVAGDAGAQGKGKGNGRGGDDHRGAPAVQQPRASQGSAKSKGLPPGQAKKRYTHAQATDIGRDVLVARGYRVQRVEVVGNTRVIYYYRGNNGRGRGHGPLERVVIRRASPTSDRYVMEGKTATKDVLQDFAKRIGL